MIEGITRQALSRLADRLASLKQQNLRIGATLTHRLDLAPAIPAQPDKLKSQSAGSIFGGTSGVLAGVLIPTETTISQHGKKPVTKITDQPAGASNYLRCSSQCTPENKAERQRIERDFWSVADEAGQIVLGMRSKLKSELGLWSLWNTINQPSEGVGERGVWLDYVFEVAWFQVAGLPLQASKEVFWNGVTYDLDSYDRTLDAIQIASKNGGFNALIGSGEPIPRPIPAWHSTIEDVVGASQYALDFLIQNLEVGSQKTQTALEPSSVDFAEACSDFLVAFEYWTKGTGVGLKANCDRIESSLAERPPKPTNKGHIGLSDWVDVVAYPIQRDLLKFKAAAVRLADLPQNVLEDWENANADHYGSFGDGRFHTAAGYLRGLAARVAYHLHNLGSAYESGGFAHNRLEFDESWQRVLNAKFSNAELDSIVIDVSVIQTLFTEQFLRTYAELDFAELSSQFGKEFKRVRAKHADKQTEPAPAQPVGTAEPSPAAIVLSVCETNNGIMIAGKLYSFKGRKVVPKLVAFFQEMIETQDYCSASSFGIRTRDIEGQPERIRELIESQPAAGTRIKPKWFN